jgi:hypothetical protein
LILVDVIHLDRRRAERESTRRRTMAPMALPLPRPAAVLDLTKSAVGQAAGTAAALAAIPARAFGVLDSVEALVKRINVVVDRVEATLDSTERILAGAEESVRQVGMISAAANVAIDEATEVTRAARTLVTDAELVSTAAGSVVAEADRVTTAAGTLVSEAEILSGKAVATMARAELIATTADELLTAYETTLRKGAPMASRFIEQLSPEEVDAAIRLIDELPKLTEHLTSDVLPILATLDRVGPDIHDLLEVTRDLKLAVAGIPGLKLLRRRGDRLTDEAAN